MRIALLLIVATAGLYETGLVELAEVARIATSFVLCTQGARGIAETVIEARQERAVASRRTLAAYLS